VRIAITLQSLEHQGGIGAYTRQILKHLLQIDRTNEYILIYPTFGQARKSLGQYQRSYSNVTEVLSKSLVPHANYWDHFVVPRIAAKYHVDLLFNPFLSVPIVGRFRKILVMHNSEWFTMPEVFWLSERLIGSLRIRAFMRAADKIISVSNAVTEDCIRATGLPQSKFRTIYHGVGDAFKVIKEAARLEAVKERYRLPDEFILFVGGIYPQKNFGGLIRAFGLVAREIPHVLVIAGVGRWKYRHDLDLIKELGLQDRIRFLGWVDPDDTAVLYNLADCFVYPSFYEGFGLCLIEAMACGCPAVAACTGALPEVAQNAALLVDPRNPIEMKDAILKLVSDDDLRHRLVQTGLSRAGNFTWEKCALETWKLFHECH